MLEGHEKRDVAFQIASDVLGLLHQQHLAPDQIYDEATKIITDLKALGNAIDTVILISKMSPQLQHMQTVVEDARRCPCFR